MNKVFLAKLVNVNGQRVRGWSPGLLLDDVEQPGRFKVIDAETDNVLIKGATDAFLQTLLRQDLMRVTH